MMVFAITLQLSQELLLRIYDEVLTVSGNMYIHGQLKLEEWTGSGDSWGITCWLVILFGNPDSLHKSHPTR